MVVGPWWVLVLSVPLLLAAEHLSRRSRFLSRFCLPPPVVVGLSISLLVLAHDLIAETPFVLQTQVSFLPWTWLVSSSWGLNREIVALELPFMVAAFTCIGLEASWRVLAEASRGVFLLLCLATILSLLQTALGVGLASAFGQSPLLGLALGALSMTGGHGTSAAFAPLLESGGLPFAKTIGLSAATFGLVVGSLMGPWLGRVLIERAKLAQPDSGGKMGGATAGVLAAPTFGERLVQLGRLGWRLPAHFALLVLCMKVGAWIGEVIELVWVFGRPLKVPPYVGAMFVAIVLRNGLHRHFARWFEIDGFRTLLFLTLGVFLSVSMMTMRLIDLREIVGPMVSILVAQSVISALFVFFVSFRVLGRDKDAAVMASGHYGFALGATPNAIANMEALVSRFGPAPRAFLTLPVTGGFMVDFTNIPIMAVTAAVLSR